MPLEIRDAHFLISAGNTLRIGPVSCSDAATVEYFHCSSPVKPELNDSVSTAYIAELADTCVVQELGCSPMREVTARRADTSVGVDRSLHHHHRQHNL